MARMWRGSGAIAVGAALGSRVPRWRLGSRAGPPLALAAVQALAVGWVLWAVLPRRLRGLGPAAAVDVAANARAWARVGSAAAGLLAVAGVSHAMLHTGLLGAVRVHAAAAAGAAGDRPGPAPEPGVPPWYGGLHPRRHGGLVRLLCAGQLAGIGGAPRGGAGLVGRGGYRAARRRAGGGAGGGGAPGPRAALSGHGACPGPHPHSRRPRSNSRRCSRASSRLSRA